MVDVCLVSPAQGAGGSVNRTNQSIVIYWFGTIESKRENQVARTTAGLVLPAKIAASLLVLAASLWRVVACGMAARLV